MKVSEKLAAGLRRRIAKGEYDEEDGLGTEASLIAQSGLSRPSVREAIRILETEGLVEVTRGARSVKVNVPNSRISARYVSLLLHTEGASLHDIYQARLLIEPTAVRYIAQDHWDTAPEVLNAIVEQEVAVLGDPVAFGRLSVQFHEALTRLCGNKTVEVLMSSLSHIFLSHSDLAAAKSTASEAFLMRGVKAHTRLVELIAACRPRDAEEFWRNHLSAVERVLLADERYQQVVDILD